MMRTVRSGSFVMIGTVLVATTCGFSVAAQAKVRHSSSSTAVTSAHQLHTTAASPGHRHTKLVNLKGAKYRYAGYGGGLQCVPFARAASGIELKGNAANWWEAAAGIYERGERPEPGSVLNFRATGRMRLGHVAVVTAVLDPRSIEIEHANWSKGSVARHVNVVDVSPANDWSQVRVALARGGDYGSTYPTYGFIYDRPDSGTMLANASAGAQTGRAVVQSASFDEVAELPTRSPAGRHGTTKRLILDAADHGFQ